MEAEADASAQVVLATVDVDESVVDMVEASAQRRRALPPARHVTARAVRAVRAWQLLEAKRVRRDLMYAVQASLASIQVRPRVPPCLRGWLPRPCVRARARELLPTRHRPQSAQAQVARYRRQHDAVLYGTRDAATRRALQRMSAVSVTSGASPPPPTSHAAARPYDEDGASADDASATYTRTAE